MKLRMPGGDKLRSALQKWNLTRGTWRSSTSRKWFSTHFRVIECAGLLIMFSTGALEYKSIRIDERLNAALNAEVIADWSVWNIVSPMQLHWIQESAQRIGEEVGAAKTDARAKRQLASFVYNYGTYAATAALLLNETLRTLMIFEKDTGIRDNTLAYLCDAAVYQVNQSISDMRDGFVKEITLHSNAGNLVHFVENFETSLYIARITDASKVCFLRREFDLKALSQRKESKANLYIAIFLAGSILLVVGKFGNWLNDCDRTQK